MTPHVCRCGLNQRIVRDNAVARVVEAIAAWIAGEDEQLARQFRAHNWAPPEEESNG